MMKDYILRSSSVSGLELPDVEKDQARALAGELATTLVEDRLNILIAAAGMVEHHVGRILWRGVGDVARTSTVVVEIFGAQEIPVIASLPESAGVVSITTVRKWDDNSEIYQAASYKLRPQSRIRLDDFGVYEVDCTVLPPSPAPAAAVEGVGRVYAYQTAFRPSVSTMSEGGSVSPPRLAGAMIRSGASELLASLRKAPS